VFLKIGSTHYRENELAADFLTDIKQAHKENK